MKKLISKFVVVSIAFAFGFIAVQAQDKVAANSDAAQGLDLYAVAELFKDSASIEKFEQALNDPDKGINNLDLNKDGQIDFINVTEQINGDTRFIVLQSAVGENDWQDVATIAVESDSGKYNLQFQGNETIYGANYYVVPASNNFSAWNVVRWLFNPSYRVYVSPYRYKVYPRWWTTRRPVAAGFYRTRVGTFVGRKNFVASRNYTVKTVSRINYRPRTSMTVTKKATVIRTTTVTPNQNIKTRKVVVRGKKRN